MAEGNLPLGVAQEPKEQARLSQGDDDPNIQEMHAITKQKKGITFAESTQSSEHSASQSSSTYKEVLSQPGPALSHRQRLAWLQRRRGAGLWVQCDVCSRWRHLPHAIDCHQLPAKWKCEMNPDKTAADCSIPETPIRLRDEEDLIHSEYTAGSVVLARLSGWPWWPAMVDDDPDTEQFYWLDGFSDIPTHYNVVFFDAYDVTRAWIDPNQLKPYSGNQNICKKLSQEKKYKKRLQAAMAQAEDAESLPLAERLSKYSFISRYQGAINEPKKVTKVELKKFQKKLKRKYNIDFPIESESSDDEPVLNNKKEKTTVIKKGNNVLIIGTPKKQKEKKSRVQKDKKIKALTDRVPSHEETLTENQETVVREENGRFQDSLAVNDTQYVETTENTTEPNKDSEVFKEPSSIAVQVGSNITSIVADTVPLDNDTSATYVPSSEGDTELSETMNTIQNRAATPGSDDFDF